MADSRKVDIFASGKGSLANMLMNRRKAIESGDPSGIEIINTGEGSSDLPDSKQMDNSPSAVTHRGYFKHNVGDES